MSRLPVTGNSLRSFMLDNSGASGFAALEQFLVGVDSSWDDIAAGAAAAVAGVPEQDDPLNDKTVATAVILAYFTGWLHGLKVGYEGRVGAKQRLDDAGIKGGDFSHLWKDLPQ